jgi:AcrR family transcriptional regulator
MLDAVGSKRGRAAPMAPEERRRAIIDAVVPLLQQHGAAVTTKQVAEAAGIAEGTIFRVFPDKRALLLATAEEIVNPAGGAAAMAAELQSIPDLRGKITATVKHLTAVLDQATVVMMALRQVLLESPPATEHTEHRPGPPRFLVESNRQLLGNLTTLLFEPHADELRVSPAKAALVLRSLVFGTWHPGMESETRLSPDEIADACLHGVSEVTR